MTEARPIVTGPAHSCNEEAPDLAALDGPALAGQVFVCSCGRAWWTQTQMTRGAEPTSVWISNTESPVPVPPVTDEET